MKKKFIVTGIILVTLSIALGAFGAHGLKKVLIDYPDKIDSFEVGIKYQMYMGLSFLWFGVSKLDGCKFLYPLWLLGVILFSFSIFLLSISPIINFPLSFLGPITPIGGLLLIVGWVHLLTVVIKSKI